MANYRIRYRDIEDIEYRIQISEKEQSIDDVTEDIIGVVTALYLDDPSQWGGEGHVTQSRKAILNVVFDKKNINESADEWIDELDILEDDHDLTKQEIREFVISRLLDIEVSFVDVRGYAIYDVQGTDDPLHVMRGSAISLVLEANEDLQFDDLYTENEIEKRVELYREDSLIFTGFLKPDGLFTDFVNERWNITLDCVDGLGILKNLSFVDENNFNIVGYNKEIDIIRWALMRTGMDLPINTDVQIWHDGMEIEEDVFDQTYLNCDRFYKDKSNDDIMDCEEVIRSTLEKYNAVIQQTDGEWFIFRPIDLARDNTRTFYHYERGVLIDTIEKDLRQTIGSQMTGFDRFHINENQRISIRGSVSKYRVKYEYGLARGLSDNPNLDFDNNGNIPGWSKFNNPNYYEEPSTGALRWDLNRDENKFPKGGLKLSPSINVDQGDRIEIKFDINQRGGTYNLPLEIKFTGDEPTQYFTSRFEKWEEFNSLPSTSTVQMYIIKNYIDTVVENPNFPNGYTVKTAAGQASANIVFESPGNGNINVTIHHPDYQDSLIDGSSDEEYSLIGTGYTVINRFDIIPEQEQELTDEGEFHTIEVKDRNSSNVKDNKTVYNGDMTSDIYEGVIKDSEMNNTSYWARKWKGVGLYIIDNTVFPPIYGYRPNERLAILHMMVEDSINIQRKPQRVFSGDIYGYINPLSIIRINGIKGDYFITNYSFDTRKNIVSLELNQVFQAPTGRFNYEYEVKKDYGKTIKPAIDG